MASLLTFLSNHQGIFNADQVTVRYDRRYAPDGKSSGSPPLPWEPQGEHLHLHLGVIWIILWQV